MKFFFILIFLIFTACSFDNKSGIWNYEGISNEKNKNTFKDFKKLSIDREVFNEEIELKKNFSFKIPTKITNQKWEDIDFDQSNNFINFAFNERKNLIFKSKKITNSKLNSGLLYDDGNLILSDEKGNLIIFSVKKNKVITSYNFYKKKYKKYKKFKKNLNIILNEGIIYVSDNFGYLYAFDYKSEKILWAIDNKIPFRSNLKVSKEKLIASDQNNRIYLFNKDNGNVMRVIPTEETKIKNNFKNNFSLNINSIFMLNTYGSLYSIDNNTGNVKWVLNLNQSTDITPSNLFNGHVVINNKNFLIVASQDATHIIDPNTGAMSLKLNLVSKVKPLITNNLLFLVSSNNLLICVNLITGEIIYSYNIDKKIAEFLEIKEHQALFKNLMIANNKIMIFLKNSYVLEFEINGNLENIFKLPNKINSNTIFIDNSIYYINHKNKLLILG